MTDDIIKLADETPLPSRLGQELAVGILRFCKFNDQIIMDIINDYEQNSNIYQIDEKLQNRLNSAFNDANGPSAYFRLAAAILNPVEEVDGYAMEHFIHWAKEIGVDGESFSDIFQKSMQRLNEK